MAFESLSDRITAAFKNLRSKGKLTEKDVKESMTEIRQALLGADVNYLVTKDLINKITGRAVGDEILGSLTPAQHIIKIVNEELTDLMGSEKSELARSSKPPTIILMCGLQGSGKTTHAAKIAKKLKKDGRRPLLVACDIYRPAAIEQLKIVGEQAEVPVFEMGQIDPVEIAVAAINHAKDYGNDYVIIDTAGRLHLDEELMNEIKMLKEKTQPHEILLVADSMTGQDAVNVAKAFNEALDITGVVLTKLDGDTRGGAAISIKAVTGKPIKFSGVGEKLGDLEEFYPDRMASRILGMGDVLTLIDSVEEQIDQKKAEEAYERMQSNKFDLNDLLEQMRQIRKMGSLQKIISMLPGANQMNMADVDENKLVIVEAIISSMTEEEKARPNLIKAGRKRRISAGSGTSVRDVNILLRQFKQMQEMMKSMMAPKQKGKRGKKGMRGVNVPNLGNIDINDLNIDDLVN